MAQLDPVIFREIPVIKKIIDDEVWYEGERRGCAVSPDDPVVRENVCQVILRIGWQIRQKILNELSAHPAPKMLPLEDVCHEHAA